MSQQPPYFKKRVTRTVYSINPNFPMDQLCARPDCHHTYARHFDPYEEWAAVGCKYCKCNTFKVARTNPKKNLQSQ